MDDRKRMPLRRHHDDDYWDRVTITTADDRARFVASIRPRFKTSGLSGDEWRVRAVAELKDPDEPTVDLVARSFHRMRDVFGYAPYFVYDGAFHLLQSRKARITVERKGIVLMTEDRPDFGDALIGLGWHVRTANEGRPDVEWHYLTDAEERAHCQQVGCAAPPAVTYHLKKLQVAPSQSVMVAPEYDFTGQYVWYCTEHATRGDAGLEDCDDNLVLVENP